MAGRRPQKATHVVWHPHAVSRADREALNGHRACIVWLTGLPGSGKSTIANELARILHERDVRAYVLDGDNVRHGLNKDLGFSREDRVENIRRIGEVAKLFLDAGVIPVAAFISPFRADRDLARALVGKGDFVEVYVKCSLEKCRERDPKGLYRKAAAGKIADVTGVDQPYEEPVTPEIVIETDALTPAASAAKIAGYLERKGSINAAGKQGPREA